MRHHEFCEYRSLCSIRACAWIYQSGPCLCCVVDSTPPGPTSPWQLLPSSPLPPVAWSKIGQKKKPLPVCTWCWQTTNETPDCGYTINHIQYITLMQSEHSKDRQHAKPNCEHYFHVQCDLQIDFCTCRFFLPLRYQPLVLCCTACSSPSEWCPRLLGTMQTAPPESLLLSQTADCPALCPAGSTHGTSCFYHSSLQTRRRGGMNSEGGRRMQSYNSILILGFDLSHIII